MNRTYMASQSSPYELMNKKIKSSKDSVRLRNLVNIVLLTHPDYKESDIKDLFCSLKNSGCTYAAFANAIIKQLGQGKDINIFLEEFQYLFGYSLYDAEKNIIDYNRLLVDLYSTLYKVGDLSAFYYNRYSYKSLMEAANNLIGEDEKYSEDNVAAKLCDEGYYSDGFDENGNLVFKDIKNPIVIKVIGTYQELAFKVFEKDFSNFSDEEIKNLFKNHNIQVCEKSYEIPSKLSGLSTTNINFWLNEFFRRKKIDFEVNVQNVAWCIDSTEELIQKINESLEKGASILVSSDHNYEIYMKNLEEKFFLWDKLENGKVGHAMFLKGISDTGDLIVSSWGKDYLIPIDYCKALILKSIFVKQKNYDLDEQVKTNVIK